MEEALGGLRRYGLCEPLYKDVNARGKAFRPRAGPSGRISGPLSASALRSAPASAMPSSEKGSER